jgi:outer membrane lipoprotein-sorting protein
MRISFEPRPFLVGKVVAPAAHVCPPKRLWRAAWNILLAGCFFFLLSAGAREMIAADKSVQDDPAAHALYNQMVEAMRKATTLSWVSDYRWEARSNTFGHATYKIWLKKPNFVRLEAMPAGSNDPSGILVGDGDYFWIYWPKQKPRYGWERTGKYAEDYEKYRNTFYMKERSPLGRHSIGHQTGNLGAGLMMTIIDPSTFHGYTDSLQPYLDGVRGLGSEKVGEDVCDVVELSFMKSQRIWQLWLAKKDHLPRKLKQVVRVSYDINFEESWSEVTVNAEIPNDRFAWSAPAGWKEWREPPIEEGLLKPGTPAPDFDLAAPDGSRIKLSNYRGQIVWLNKWRCG